MESDKPDQTAAKGDRQDLSVLKREFSARLGAIMGEMNLSQVDLVRITGISRSKISDYYTGKFMPSAESAVLLSDALGVRTPWLILGRGDRAEGAVTTSSYRVPILDVRLSAGSGALGAKDRQIGEMAISPEIMEQIGRSNTDGLHFVRAKGDSMEPIISDGAWVLIDEKDTEFREAIFAFRLGDSVRIKRLGYFGLAGIEAISANPIYPPEGIEGELLNHFQIIGRALWAGTRL